MMKRVHHLLDAGVVIPPMNVKDIDIRRAQLLERVFDAQMERLQTIPAEVSLDGDACVITFVVRSVLKNECSVRYLIKLSRGQSAAHLRCDHKLVSDTSLLRPLPN